MTGRPIGLIGTAETENLGEKHPPAHHSLGSGVTTATSARATPHPRRVRRPRCVSPLERSRSHSSSRFSWRLPRPPGASALTRAKRRPPRAPPSHSQPRLRASTPPNAPTPTRRPANPASSPRAKTPPTTVPRATPPPKATPPRRPGRRRRSPQKTPKSSAGGGGEAGTAGRDGGGITPTRTTPRTGAPPAPSRALHPPSPLTLSLNLPTSTPAPPLLPQRILELRLYSLLQVRGREGPRVCARDDRRGRRGARGEGISRSRPPPARCARVHASRVVETNGRGVFVRRVAGRRGGGARGGALERRREGRRVLLALGLRAGGLRGVRRGGWRRVLRTGLGAPGRVLMVRATQEGTE